MDARTIRRENGAETAAGETAPDLSGWFSVSGDVDDFIYYGEETAQSEK